MQFVVLEQSVRRSIADHDAFIAALKEYLHVNLSLLREIGTLWDVETENEVHQSKRGINPASVVCWQLQIADICQEKRYG